MEGNGIPEFPVRPENGAVERSVFPGRLFIIRAVFHISGFDGDAAMNFCAADGLNKIIAGIFRGRNPPRISSLVIPESRPRLRTDTFEKGPSCCAEISKLTAGSTPVCRRDSVRHGALCCSIRNKAYSSPLCAESSACALRRCRPEARRSAPSISYKAIVSRLRMRSTAIVSGSVIPRLGTEFKVVAFIVQNDLGCVNRNDGDAPYRLSLLYDGGFSVVFKDGDGIVSGKYGIQGNLRVFLDDGRRLVLRAFRRFSGLCFPSFRGTERIADIFERPRLRMKQGKQFLSRSRMGRRNFRGLMIPGVGDPEDEPVYEETPEKQNKNSE